MPLVASSPTTTEELMIEVLPDMPSGVTGIRVSGRLSGDELRQIKPTLDDYLQAGEIRIVEDVTAIGGN
jgi:hypothetical protein